MVKVRLDRQATATSLLIVLGFRRNGQKVVLAIKNMGGESEAAGRAVLDDLLARGLAKPELVMDDGGKGLEAALASLWDDVPVQRCSLHKERHLLAHAPKHLHDALRADFNAMMHAKAAGEVLARRKALLAKGKLRCRPVATSLEEAGERLFTSVRYPPEQWRSLRTTHAYEVTSSLWATFRTSRCTPTQVATPSLPSRKGGGRRRRRVIYSCATNSALAMESSLRVHIYLFHIVC